MYIVAFVTASNKSQARQIAGALIKRRLAACVNIVEKIESFFWWEGKVDCAKEALLIIKSKKTKLKEVIKTVKSMHSYFVPEIIVLPIVAGEKKYLRWIDESVR
jgi:periplasmic divalent cation tolerance protein